MEYVRRRDLTSNNNAMQSELQHRNELDILALVNVVLIYYIFLSANLSSFFCAHSVNNIS